MVLEEHRVGCTRGAPSQVDPQGECQALWRALHIGKVVESAFGGVVVDPVIRLIA